VFFSKKTDGQSDQNAAVHQLHPCINRGLHMNDLSRSLREKEMFKNAFPHYAAPYIHFWCVPLIFNDGHVTQNCAVMPLQQTITKGCLFKTEF